MRILKGLLPALLLVFALGFWIVSRPGSENVRDTAQESAEAEGMEPRNFKLPNAKGEQIELNGFRGRPVILNFWATWCPPCLEELPSLLKLAEWAKKELGVETIAVSVDQGWAPVEKLFSEKKFWPRKALPLTILMNPDGGAAAAYGAAKYPETYFIDRKFKVIRKFVGAQDWNSQEIRKWITENSK